MTRSSRSTVRYTSAATRIASRPDSDGALVGGLYGVSLGGAFFGESMFSRVTDASKVALAHLIARLVRGGYRLLDTQFVTDHLGRFGTIEISRARYRHLLAEALKTERLFSGRGFGPAPRSYRFCSRAR